MAKYIVEFIGTFFLVFTIAVSGNPVAIGAILIAMVYMAAYISGAHFNPAVTLAVLMRGKINKAEALRYMLVQVIAGAVAGGVFWWMAGQPFLPSPSESLPFAVAFVGEILFTFALASVVLHVGTSNETKDNMYYGAAIGLTVMAGAFTLSQVSGAAFNPAVALGPILSDYKNISSHTNQLILYIVGPLLGGAFAAVIYKLGTKK